MKALRRILALVHKELLSLLKDKKSRAVIIVPPIVQTLVFGYAATFDLEHVPFAVYNEDAGAPARELVARFSSSPSFERVARIRSDFEVAPMIDAREALLVLHLGPRFSRDLLGHRRTSLQVIVDGRDSNTSMLVLGYASAIVARFNADWAQRTGQPRAASLAVAPGSTPICRAAGSWCRESSLCSRWW